MIRPATPDDVPVIARLIRDLAEYERLLDRCVFKDSDLRESLFGARKYAEVILAEDAGAVVADRTARDVQLEKIAAREDAPALAPAPTAALVKRATKAARWFDVKEHWVALGMLATFALALVLAFWDPARDGPGLAPIVVGLAIVIAATVWLGAIVGVLTSTWRAV